MKTEGDGSVRAVGPGGSVLLFFAPDEREIVLQDVHPAARIVIEKTIQRYLDVDGDDVVSPHAGRRRTPRAGAYAFTFLVAGERDPKKLAQMARSRMRPKRGLLEEAFAGLPAGSFDDHHRFLLARMLQRIDQTDADIADLDAQIEEHLAPFADAVARLDEIPGIGRVAAAVIIAEIGLDMTLFPTPGHLASWARFAPGIKSSAGKNKGNGATGHGNRYLARVLGDAAAGAGRTDTFLGARYRRITRRRGKKKALVAVGRSILVIAWHLLSDPDARFADLGADFYDTRRSTAARKRQHIRELEALGYRVTLHPAA